MLRAFYSAATGMHAQERLIDNAANNLANVNTAGFKKSQVEFADLMYNVEKAPGATSLQGQAAPIGIQIGNGTRVVGTANDHAQGVAVDTGNPFDVSIEGDGFFKVLMPSGEARYSRDGNFHVNNQGQLVTSSGFLIDPQITIPQDATAFSIGLTGEVSYQLNGQLNTIGTLLLSRFVNPQGLQNMGGNLYAATQASGQEIQGQPLQPGYGSLRQGAYEGSNVEVVSELVSLITAQRAYEINSRAIRAGDEMLSNTGQLIR
jgi:flagellar basal-body rod protein FlgG